MSNRIAVIGLYGMSALFRLEHLPVTGETVQSTELVFEPGGKGYNQAMGALKMGADVFFATAVGQDAYGREAESVFVRDGFKEFRAFAIAGAATAFAAVASDNNGGNVVIVEQGGCAGFSAEMMDALEPEIAKSKILLLQCEMPVEAIRRGLEIAKRHGLYTILNPAPAKRLDAGLLSLVDLLTPNWGEALSIAGLDGTAQSPDNVCKAMRELGCGSIIITLGEKGSYVSPVGEKGYIQPPFLVSCVDSTGAGDNFNGALAACIGEGMSLCDAVRMATASSALSVTKRGVMAAVPTRREVIRFLDSQQ